jgi:hypothetical protein
VFTRSGLIQTKQLTLFVAPFAAKQCFANSSLRPAGATTSSSFAYFVFTRSGLIQTKQLTLFVAPFAAKQCFANSSFRPAGATTS